MSLPPGCGDAASADSAASDDPCDGVVCEAPAPFCDGDVAVTYPAAGTCVDGTCQFEEQRETCDEACAFGVCAEGDSLGLAEVREAEPDTPLSIPVTAVVTYVLPQSAKPGGFFVQNEAEGPAVFVDPEWIETLHHDDEGASLIDVPDVAAGDVLSFEVAAVGDNYGMTHVRDVVPRDGAAWSFEGSRDAASLATDISEATDLRTGFERWESRLVTVTGTLALPVRTAGDGFSQWPLATEGMPDPPHGLLLRVLDEVLAEDAVAAELREGCEVTATVPIWGFRDPESGLDYAQATAYRAEDIVSVRCP